MTAHLRSVLYVNPLDEAGVAAAIASVADALLLDLEDSVHHSRKADAREAVAGLLRRGLPKPAIVRINPLNSEHAAADAAALSAAAPAYVAVPKVDSPRAVAGALSLLEHAHCDAPLWCLLETPLAIERAFEIATASPRVARVWLGEADLALTLGAFGDDGLAYVRSRVICAARAAALPPPLQSVWLALDDERGLVESCRRGRALGFFGRTVATPRQAEIVNDAYMPSTAEVDVARAIVAAFEHANGNGRSSAVLADGRAVDSPIAESARRILSLVNEFPA